MTLYPRDPGGKPLRQRLASSSRNGNTIVFAEVFPGAYEAILEAYQASPSGKGSWQPVSAPLIFTVLPDTERVRVAWNE